MLTADSATIREKEGGLFLYLRSAPDGAGLIYNVQEKKGVSGGL